MADQTTQQETGLVAELNDLLQLDHDAIQAYTVAIDNIQSPEHRDRLQEYRRDHERHIQDLTRLIHDHDGKPIELAHVPSGFFKLALQKVATAGSDREILLAFKANERQVRDKYRRHADRPHPESVADVLRRNAQDEIRHYDWAANTLESLGYGRNTPVGKAEAAFEKVHEKAADVMESGERRAMHKAEGVRRNMKDAGGRARNAAAERLQQTSRTMHHASDRMAEKGGGAAKAGSYGHQVASNLENAARYVRSRDMTEMRTDIRRQVDRYPIRSALITLGAGFLVGRMFR